MIDLHTHTSASDGTYTPTQLVEEALRLKLNVLAITDHDTIDGLLEAERVCSEKGITFIPGIEIEIEYEGGEFHLLGLGIWDWKGAFWKKLQVLQAQRLERNLLILAKMQADGIVVEYEEIKKLAGGAIVGRPHIAQYLVQKGIAYSIEDAFHRFISPGKPYYAKKKAPSLKEGVDLIHSGGGKALIAHPDTLCLGSQQAETVLRMYKDMGVDGIEAYHPRVTKAVGAQWEAMADRLGLLVSAGSDFHGPSIPDRSLGRSSEGMWIEDSFAKPFLPNSCGILKV
ncbi:MAG: PHP domain-containing protein [Spirochaetes bacterium]|nr:PHP domain-containing protein [Spirochaetota bacterium]